MKAKRSWEGLVWLKARHAAKKKGVKLDAAKVIARIEVERKMREPMTGEKPQKPPCQQKAYVRHVERTYGLKWKAFLRMFQDQNAACAVCLVPLELFSLEHSPVVDHCHATGKVRGLLCQGCNVRVGRVETMAERALYRAAKAYIKNRI